MDKDLCELIDAIDQQIAEDKCPAFTPSEWEDLNSLWMQLKERIED